jgi:hypothetical protein
MKKKYIVGIGSTQPYRCETIFAKSARAARWLYVNLYAPPCTRYMDTWCNGVRARQYASKTAAIAKATQP